MSLRLYSSHLREKTPFKTLKQSQVKMYCCGPTVYDFLHIGNFRGAVFYNFLRNWLEFLGYTVDFIYNFTDVDDKILNRAKEQNTSPSDLAEKYIKEFQTDYQNLKLRPHSRNPRATETIKEMVALIQKCLDKGAAYEVDGDVFYSVNSFSKYGELSGRKTEELISGIRVEPHSKKRNPLDFSLWKKVKPEESWSWDSPWGKGRPGWHLECTAMIHKYLGEEIDIHGGGTDLIFPHHENERAQSESCCGKTYVRYWVHNGMISIDGSKMSKSIGNIVTMRKFLNQFPGEVFKYLILSSHYRSEVNISENSIHQAIRSLARVYSCLSKAEKQLVKKGKETPLESFSQVVSDAEKQVTEAFNDDFATPKAFSSFFFVVTQFNSLFTVKKTSAEELSWCSKKFLNFFKVYGEALSLFQEEPHFFLKKLDDQILKEKKLSREDIDLKVNERSLARKNKDYKKADQLRQELNDMSIALQDSPEGTVWEVMK